MPPAQGRFVPIWCRESYDLLSCQPNTHDLHSKWVVGLDRITRVDDLGVLLDPKLKFSDHISTIVNKARGVLGFIKP